MDSITHALAASVIFAVAGRPELVPFAALGAVCPDVDVIFQRFSDRDPGRYIFTHGGITHSIPGALATAMVATVPGLLAAAVLGYSVAIPLAFAAAAVGVLTHVVLDFLAFPGIPLLYPLTDHKYTLGITAGPTPYLLAASLAYGVFLLAGQASINDPGVYAGFFLLVLAVAAVLKLYVTLRAGGKAIPGFSPLHWLIVKETPRSFQIFGYHLLRGAGAPAEFEKLCGVSPADVSRLEAVPGVRRMRYHSYVVTAAREGDSIVLTDPLREQNYLWYPPYFKRFAYLAEAQTRNKQA